MIDAVLFVSFLAYPKEIRSLAGLDAADLYGNSRSGYVVAAQDASRRREMLVVAPSGRVVHRRWIDAGSELRGLDGRNRPVVSRVPSKHHGSGGPDVSRTDWYGDVTVKDLGASDHWLGGRFAGATRIYGNVAFAPLAERAEVVCVGGSFHHVTRLIGKGLEKRVEVRPRFGSATLTVSTVDRSVASVGRGEVALFLDPEGVSPEILVNVPRLGVAYVPPRCEVDEKLLAVMSLGTGECALLARVQQARDLMALSVPLSKSLAHLRPGKLLLSHNDQLLELDTNPKSRVLPTQHPGVVDTLNVAGLTTAGGATAWMPGGWLLPHAAPQEGSNR